MKAKKKAGGKTMPIPHERFAHMLTALLGHIRGLNRERSIRTQDFATYRIQRHAAGEILDESTALEIADALYRLRALYCEEALRHTLPNRREKASELQDAENAQEVAHVSPAGRCAFPAAPGRRAAVQAPRRYP